MAHVSGVSGRETVRGHGELRVSEYTRGDVPPRSLFVHFVPSVSTSVTTPGWTRYFPRRGVKISVSDFERLLRAFYWYCEGFVSGLTSSLQFPVVGPSRSVSEN